MLSSLTKSSLLIIILSLFYIQFFGSYVFFVSFTEQMIAYLVLLFLALKEVVKSRESYSNIERVLLAYCVLLTISIVYSVFFNGQSFRGVIAKYINYYGILFYFVLKGSNITAKQTFKIILIISILMISCYIFQYYSYPKIYFADAEHNIYDDMGIFRMRFPCTLCLFLMFLYGINSYIIKRHPSSLIYSALAGFPIVMMEFRSLTVILAVSVFFMIVNYGRGYISEYLKFVVVFLVIGYTSLQIPLVQEKVDSMIERNERDDIRFSDNTRFLALGYYSQAYSENPIGWILGNGEPLFSDIGPDERNNEYQSKMYTAYSFGLLWNDIGLIGLSGIIGMPAALLLAYIYLYLIRKSRSKKHLYIRYCMLVILLGSVWTTMEAYRNGNLMLLGFVLYLLENSSNEKTIIKIQQ